MTKIIETRQTSIADEQIVQLYWERNEQAIKETDIKYGRFLLRIAYNILHDKSDCEECKNDTYLGIWNVIPPNRPTVFPTFISKIMRNIAINRYNEKHRKKRIPSEMTVLIDDLSETLQSDYSPEADYLAKELGKHISKYLHSLTDRQQYIFVGRFYMGETLEALANELGVSIPTVHREIGKIKQGIKEYLERNVLYD